VSFICRKLRSRSSEPSATNAGEIRRTRFVDAARAA